MGLVETHEKYRKMDWGEGVDLLSVMREQADQKGGGILLMKEKGGCTWEKTKSECNDILNAKLNLGKVSIYIMLVYMDVKDKERNKSIYEKLNMGMEGAMNSELPVMVMGDFNGHAGFLGNQELNYNGTKMLEFMEKWNLILMNCDTNCSGTFTRIERDAKSVIDYIMINDRMYGLYE